MYLNVQMKPYFQNKDEKMNLDSWENPGLYFSALHSFKAKQLKFTFTHERRNNIPPRLSFPCLFLSVADSSVRP